MMDIPLELVEEFARGNGAIFVGAGLSQEAGLPGWADLISELALELDGYLPDADYRDIAQYYDIEHGRNRLVQKIRDKLNTLDMHPTSVHEVLARLPMPVIFTTNYDNLLERGLGIAGREFDLVINSVDANFWRRDHLQLVKLHGDLRRPESIVITATDYDLYFAHHPALTRLLEYTLQTRTVLFLGYSVRDPDFRLLLAQVREEGGQGGRFARNLYTVQFGAPSLVVKDLERRGLKVIDLGSEGSKTDLLHAWLRELNDRVTAQVQKNKIGGEKSDDSITVDDTAYRQWLQDYTDSIDIRGISFRGSQEAHRLPLLDLYTELHVRKRPPESSLEAEFDQIGERIPLQDVVANTHCMTILGDPGAGKTTFLRYLARTYVVDTSKPLPLLLRVTDLYDHVMDNQRSDGPHGRPRRSGRDWLVSYWLEQSQAFGWGFTEPWLTEQFRQGEVLMLLDGLDELPTHEARVRVIQIIDSAAQKWRKCRWVLTSRPGALRGRAIPLDFSTAMIDDLGDEEIWAFLNAWVRLLFHGKSTESTRGYQSDQYLADLYHAICGRTDVRRLARNPVMLTAMAVVHWNEKKLPEGKAELYEAVIRWLIRARRELPNRKDEKKTRQCYQSLALEMFQHPQGRQTQVGRLWAAEKIATYFDGNTQEEQIQAALQFLTQEEIDTGIVVRRGQGNIAFRHLSFQEYLAACEIASKTDDSRTGWWALIKDKLDAPEWAEVLRFAPVRLLTLGDARVNLFIKRVIGTRQDSSLSETARVVGFLKDIISDLTVYNYSVTDVEGYVCARDQVMQIFTEQGLGIDLQIRYDAAVAIGRSGDPRLLNPEKNWIYIPGGMLWVGAQKESLSLPNYDEFAEEEEQPVHQVYAASFEVGKYPVTVHEYAQFIEDGGYEDPSLWDPVGWEWRVNNDIFSPMNWDEQLLYPNCPVVYVCWYEARAYCNWLTRGDGRMEYRLPTEAEWEYTARHGQEAYSSYCFGNISPHELRDEINWGALAGLGQLSPVGLFPRDRSYDGVMDTSGNVREWTQDPGSFEYSPEPLQASLVSDQPSSFRIVRGGNWNFIASACRSASRTRILPQYRWFDVGFRVVRTLEPIPIKGKIPAKQYRTTLADVFAKSTGSIFSQEDADKRLAPHTNGFPGLNAGIVFRLFPEVTVQENRPFDRLPTVLSDAPPTKLDYNLLYQDTRLKLAVEEKLGADCESSRYEEDAKNLMEIVSILLRTRGIKEYELWRGLTDNDLDALIYMILDTYDPNHIDRLLKIGYQTNELALEGLPSLDQLSLEELIGYQVFAGAVWWTDRGPSLEEQFPTKGKFEINDLDLLKQDVLSKDAHMVFVFDDNGELVWDLAVILRLLNENSRLRVTGVVNTRIIANNSNIYTLKECLKHPKLRGLQTCGRFAVFEEDHYRSSIDLTYCSKSLLNLLQSADLAFVKGTAAFETMQRLPVDIYYAFVNYGSDVQGYTGLEQGSGVLVRIPREKMGYRYGERTLRDIYPTLRS